MRIGLLTTSFPREEGDVPGTFVLGFARALVELGHSIEVLAPEPADTRFVREPAWPGVAVHWVRYLPRSWEHTFYGAGVLDNLARDPRAWLGTLPFVAALFRGAAARASGWDAVVSHWALPCALVAGRIRKRRPHLAILHSADVHLIERLPGAGMLAKQVAASAQALVFSSRDLRSRFLACLDPMTRISVSGQAHVCAMGIAPVAPFTQNRDALRRELGLDGFTLLSLGRLIPIKGIDVLIDALAGVANVQLIVAGDGPERSRLEALARTKQANVRFVGEVREPSKTAWLQAADVFVLPSLILPSGRTEGMPTTLLEAMSHGLPVIASRSGGISDLVEHAHNGWLVTPGDRYALRTAIEQLRDPDCRAQLARAALQTAQNYAWPALAPHFEALLTGELAC